MNVSLTPELEKIVNEKVKTGLYNSTSEVIRESLRLLVERDRVRESQHEELHSKIAEGLSAADRGEFVDGPSFFKGLRRKSAKRRGRKA